MRKRTGTIYKEVHNHGKRKDTSGHSQRFVRGVGKVHVSGYRWVAEITVYGKRFRKRSAFYDVVTDWLSDMIEKYRD